MITRNVKSDIFSSAWYLFTKGIYKTFSEALKNAWKKYKLIMKLKSGIVDFSYYSKSNDEIRKAKGTLLPQYFNYVPKGTGKKANPDIIVYHDLEKDHIRKCRVENIRSF